MQAVARKFNQLQRREASTGGTQSLIDLRQSSSYFNDNTTHKAVHRSALRPKSSGGRITAPKTLSSTTNNNSVGKTAVTARAQVSLPCLAGATLQRSEDGGGFTAVRQPPLRASKGLPSYKQVNDGFARKRAKERKSASNANSATSRGGTNNSTDLEFAAQIARRDDILQVGMKATLDLADAPPPLCYK